jgi:SagB-type dehydrogenase family enzyme
MHLDFSKFFHRASKDTSDGGAVRIPKDTKDWPEEWKTVVYKSYGKLLQLPLPATFNSALFTHIAQRQSRDAFSGVALSLKELSSILKYSCGEIGPTESGMIHRAQPSGGARYPIEAYVLVFQESAELPTGVYHYNVKHHSLDIVWKRQFSKKDIANLFSYEWVQNSSAALILTGVFSRTKMKYGQRGLRYVLLEAGHIGQNVYLTSQELGIGCTAMGGSKDGMIEDLLGIDGESESLVYSLILGK